MSKLTKRQLKSIIKEVINETRSILKEEKVIEDNIQLLLKKYNLVDKLNVKKMTFNNDGTIDYNSDVDLSDLGLKEIPIPFNKINGSYFCNDNQLTSLKGSPKIVKGHFYCGFNNLTSLKGSPKIVKGHFYCGFNNLTSLQDSPKIVNGDFGCFDNKLISLEGSPKEVKGHFYCSGNKLTSLDGAPKIVKGNFYCRNNPIKFTKEDVIEICRVKGSVIT